MAGNNTLDIIKGRMHQHKNGTLSTKQPQTDASEIKHLSSDI